MSDRPLPSKPENANRRCAHGKLFNESCEGCGYIHPRDRDPAQQVQLSRDEDTLDAVGVREKFRAIHSKEAQFIALCVTDWIEKQFKALAPASPQSSQPAASSELLSACKLALAALRDGHLPGNTTTGDRAEAALEAAIAGHPQPRQPSRDDLMKALCCPNGCVREDDCWSKVKRYHYDKQADAILKLFPLQEASAEGDST